MCCHRAMPLDWVASVVHCDRGAGWPRDSAQRRLAPRLRGEASLLLLAHHLAVDKVRGFPSASAPIALAAEIAQICSATNA